MSLNRDMFDLEGKVALVTGAALGLGRSFAKTLAGAGADLAIVDINPDRLDETGTMLKKLGGSVLNIVADVSNPSDVSRMVDETYARFGQLDIAVNNAGIVHKPYRFHETPLEEWHRLMGINLTGVFVCMQKEIALMLQARQGVEL